MLKFENTKLTAKFLTDGILSGNMLPVFDMDGVFANATHRQICNPDGSLNLDKYREMSTAEYISKDKELPLIEVLQNLSSLGREFHICTARVACENTIKWLSDRNIFPQSVMARDGMNDNRRDYVLKTDKLTEKFCVETLSRILFIDDNIDNCKAIQKLGASVINIPFEGH